MKAWQRIIGLSVLLLVAYQSLAVGFASEVRPEISGPASPMTRHPSSRSASAIFKLRCDAVRTGIYGEQTEELTRLMSALLDPEGLLHPSVVWDASGSELSEPGVQGVLNYILTSLLPSSQTSRLPSFLGVGGHKTKQKAQLGPNMEARLENLLRLMDGLMPGRPYPLTRRVIMGALMTLSLQGGHAWSTACDGLLQRITERMILAHRVGAANRRIIHFSHVSKSGGTTACTVAGLNGCRRVAACELMNCMVPQFDDYPRWVDDDAMALVLDGTFHYFASRYKPTRQDNAEKAATPTVGGAAAEGHLKTSAAAVADYTAISATAHTTTATAARPRIGRMNVHDVFARRRGLKASHSATAYTAAAATTGAASSTTSRNGAAGSGDGGGGIDGAGGDDAVATSGVSRVRLPRSLLLDGGRRASQGPSHGPTLQEGQDSSHNEPSLSDNSIDTGRTHGNTPRGLRQLSQQRLQQGAARRTAGLASGVVSAVSVGLSRAVPEPRPVGYRWRRPQNAYSDPCKDMMDMLIDTYDGDVRYNFFMNEYTLPSRNESREESVTLCTKHFVNAIMLREPTARLKSHLEWIAGLYLDQHPSRASKALAQLDADTWRAVAPAVVDNYLTRSLLGEKVFHSRPGQLTQTHLRRARLLLLQYDVIMSLEDSESNMLTAQYGLGWGVPLNTTHLRKNVWRERNADLLKLLMPSPPAMQEFMAGQDMDVQLYKFGRLLQWLDGLAFQIARDVLSYTEPFDGFGAAVSEQERLTRKENEAQRAGIPAGLRRYEGRRNRSSVIDNNNGEDAAMLKPAQPKGLACGYISLNPQQILAASGTSSAAVGQ